MSKSGSYIFKEINDKLVFVGDFERFYQADNDPWGQSASSEMSIYYQLSRQRLMSILSTIKEKSMIVEVGCGLGYVTKLISDGFPQNNNIVGLDISETAINKAKLLFPDLKFICADITSPRFKYDFGHVRANVVILNQLLWYILESLPNVMANIYSTLEDDGFLIISNAFAREQRYGTEFIDHFHGAAHFFSKLDGFKLIHACFYNDNEEHDDAHFLLKKCS
ncbi:class I SAM-dependent methyltransferase [Aeromonas veronii]|uniref:class I SAM-dependent methyltransferase n=1 Tax=Aeromonas veronii TaxID=654 RepID=UPI001F408447|nr:class I SAM-dependent methyltransferase [Aeromonas veronii]MCF5760840.1 class I SAM-dependent methyltransferase [Aeromonas veronii]